MKFTAQNWKIALVAGLVLMAIAMAFGYHIPVEASSLGLLAIGDTESVGAEIKDLLQKQGENFAQFKLAHDNRLKTVEEDMREIAKKMGRPQLGGAVPSTKRMEQYIDTKSGKTIPVLAHADKLSALEHKEDGAPSIGRLLRGIVLGGRASDASELAEERKSLSINVDPSGGYTVAGALSNEWIDSLRSNLVLSKAGALTLPMDTSSLSLARVVADPTTAWHTENADITASDPTFGSVNLNAKTLVCLVKLSLELSQDSVNIEQILQSTINSAMAGAIDRAGLVGVTSNAAAAPGGVMNLLDRNKVTSIGAPTSWDFLIDGMYELALDNVLMENIGAFVGHPAIWKKMRKLKTGITNDNTPLEMPAEIAALPKLWTTAAPLTGGTTAAGVIADWRDLIMGIRKDITVRVLSETFMGSNLQIAVLAYARVDFAATRQESFCTLEGITV